MPPTAGGTVIGIVPGDDPADANPHCTHVVAAATGIARNLAVVASAEAVIAIGGAWGTLSEIAHARAARAAGDRAGELGAEPAGPPGGGDWDQGRLRPGGGGELRSALG